jgi:hypothetical protein
MSEPTMPLADALRIVIADEHAENPGAYATDAAAVESARSITMDDVLGCTDPGDDPRIVPAYQAVLDATDVEIESALRSLA